MVPTKLLENSLLIIDVLLHDLPGFLGAPQIGWAAKEPSAPLKKGSAGIDYGPCLIKNARQVHQLPVPPSIGDVVVADHPKILIRPA